MKRLISAVLYLWVLAPLFGQTVTITLDTMMATPGDTISYHLYVDQPFNSITGAQLSLQWDPDIISYVSADAVTGNLQTRENLGPIGKLGMVWNAGTDSLTFANRSSFVIIDFEVVGYEGQSSFLKITDRPTPILLVGCCSDNESDPIYPLQRFKMESNEGLLNVDASILTVAHQVTQPICHGDSTGEISTATSGGIRPYAFSWRSDGGFLSTDENLANLSAGTYYLTVSDQRGFEFTDSFHLVSPPPLSIPLAETASFCAGASLEIGLMDASFEKYLWSTGDTTPLITVDIPGNYSLFVFDTLGCRGRDSILVRETPAPTAEMIPEEDFLCLGQNTRIEASGSERLTWLDTSRTLVTVNDSISVAMASPIVDTEYGLIAANACGADTTFLTLIVTSPLGSAGGDTCIGRGGSVQLQASGGIDYQWFESPFPLSDPSAPNPTAKPDEDTDFVVEITDQNGCTIIDSVRVAVADDPLSFIPAINVITPNNDGFNDYLEFDNLAKYGVNTLQVFNRWGEIIYSAVGYQNDDERWDGTYKGKPLPAGAYFYLLRINDFQIKQTITLLRE